MEITIFCELSPKNNELKQKIIGHRRRLREMTVGAKQRGIDEREGPGRGLYPLAL